MALQGKLRHPNRFITTHNSEGKAILDTSIKVEAPFYSLPKGEAAFSQAFVTDAFPTTLTNDADLNTYRAFLKDPPGLVVNRGTVLRYVDMPPGALSPMHRTVSLDYGVVLEGEVELVLDSGETSVLKRGDVCIQRGTMHAWRNVSETEWARMLYVLQPCKNVEVDGEELKEEYGGMSGVKASD